MQSKLFDTLDGAIHRDPRHHLRMGELPSRAADFPDAFVRLLPIGFEEVQERALEAPCVLARRQSGASRQVQ